MDQEDVQLLLSGVQTTESPLYKIFQDKKEDIQKFLPADRYEKFDKNIKLNTVAKKAYNADTKTWNDSYFMTETQKFLSKEEADKILKRMKANRALKNKDIPAYEKLIMELYQDYSAASSEELNSLAWNFFENVSNKLLWKSNRVGTGVCKKRSELCQY
ncbi:hypothetical protein EJ377_03275 [Chryseobacterium arthrosphaerae]|uniref:Uncharacterized protein n=1 Tax=Chryseobacterium arthrosphaerae TaxID=651561 RepID=A0A3S0NNQ4_9FLAO|nr:hypothetical protein EJ377_03275 [Chryseobacterium arthrosphaerae]